jgi:alkylation response protein AidB-like acyl-CoA dehydrogenase
VGRKRHHHRGHGSGDGYTLTGEKMFVLDGHTANLIIVAARTAKGVSLFTVAGDAAGLTRTALSTDGPDPQAGQARVRRTPRPSCSAPRAKAGPCSASVLDLAAVGLAAEQVGGAQKVLEMAVEYAKVRVQFGRPIGSFQAIKHKCADMLLEVESAKSAAYYGLWCAAEQNDELPRSPRSPRPTAARRTSTPLPRTSRSTVASASPGSTRRTCTSSVPRASELLFGDPTYHRELLAQRIGI